MAMLLNVTILEIKEMRNQVNEKNDIYDIL